MTEDTKGKGQLLLLAKNTFLLGATQVLGFLIPLFLLPYLTRIIESDSFGKFAYYQAICAFLALLPEWGFSFFGAALVTKNTNDNGKLSFILSNVLFAKTFLASLSIALGLIFLSFEKPNETHVVLFAATLFSNLSITILPLWFFQGKERIAEISIFSFVVRLLQAASTIALIKSNNDLFWFPLCQALANLFLSVAAIFLIRVLFKVCLTKPSLKESITLIKNGAPLFMSNCIISIYTTLTPALLQWSCGDSRQVALFSTSERLLAALKALWGSFMQAVFPFFVRHGNHKSTKIILNRLIKYSAFFATGVSLALSFLAEPIMTTVFGNHYAHSSIAFSILIYAFPAVAISNIIGIQALVGTNRFRSLLISVVTGAFVQLILLGLLGKNGAQGASISVVCAEWVIAIAMIRFYHSNEKR